MVDTGTTYVYMATGAYRALRREIESECQRTGCGGASLLGDCWEIPRASEGLKHFPTILFHLDRDVEKRWEANAYLYRDLAKKAWCYAFEDDGPGAASTLGAGWMLHYDVIFNKTSQQLGFAPARCPEHRRADLDESEISEAWSVDAFHLDAFAKSNLGTTVFGGAVIFVGLVVPAFTRHLWIRYVSQRDMMNVFIPTEIDGEAYSRADMVLELEAHQ